MDNLLGDIKSEMQRLKWPATSTEDEDDVESATYPGLYPRGWVQVIDPNGAKVSGPQEELLQALKNIPLASSNAEGWYSASLDPLQSWPENRVQRLPNEVRNGVTFLAAQLDTNAGEL